MNDTPLNKIIYAGSERCANLLHLTHFSANDPFLYMAPQGKSPFMVVSTLELERARKQRNPQVDVLSFEQFADSLKLSHREASIANLIAKYACQEKIFDWTVDSSFPLELALHIADTEFPIEGTDEISGQRITFDVPDGLFCPEREIKTPQEVEAIRQAERVAQKGFERGVQILQEASIGNDGILYWNGEQLTSETMHGEVNAEIARHGGSTGDLIIAPGLQGADPHQAGYGPIPANALIVFDIFPRATSGYYGDLSRTVLKGHASDQQKAMFSAVYDAQQKVIAALKPGMPGIQAHTLAHNVMSLHGFATDMQAKIPFGFIHGLGHGVGLDIHETPSLNTRNSKGLVAGNVVTVEPGLYYPEIGGVRIEDIVHITENGCEDLTDVPVFLEIE